MASPKVEPGLCIIRISTVTADLRQRELGPGNEILPLWLAR